MEEVAFPPDRFDLVVSSMAIHYLADYHGLCRHIASWLVRGGVLVCSTEHPVCLSRATAKGWIRDAAGRPCCWAVDRYDEEGYREESWIVDGVRKYHRRQSTLLNGLIAADLTIERVLEPMPDEAMPRRHPD